MTQMHALPDSRDTSARPSVHLVSGDLLAFMETPTTMKNSDGLRNYRTGDNPEYDRMAAEACRAESKDAQDARLLRDAPGMVNAYRPLFNDIEKAAPRPSLWRRLVAFFR